MNRSIIIPIGILLALELISSCAGTEKTQESAPKVTKVHQKSPVLLNLWKIPLPAPMSAELDSEMKTEWRSLFQSEADPGRAYQKLRQLLSREPWENWKDAFHYFSLAPAFQPARRKSPNNQEFVQKWVEDALKIQNDSLTALYSHYYTKIRPLNVRWRRFTTNKREFLLGDTLELYSPWVGKGIPNKESYKIRWQKWDEVNQVYETAGDWQWDSGTRGYYTKRKMDSPGKYRLSLYNSLFIQSHIIKVSNLQLSAVHSGELLILWAYMKDAKLSPPYDVKFSWGSSASYQLKTDDQGLVGILLPKKLPSIAFTATVEKKGHRVELTNNLNPIEIRKEPTYCHLFTDKDSYAPGEILRWWAYTGKGNSGLKSFITPDSLEVSLTDPFGLVWNRLPWQAGIDGLEEDSLLLPLDKVGDYHLSIRYKSGQQFIPIAEKKINVKNPMSDRGRYQITTKRQIKDGGIAWEFEGGSVEYSDSAFLFFHTPNSSRVGIVEPSEGTLISAMEIRSNQMGSFTLEYAPPFSQRKGYISIEFQSGQVFGPYLLEPGSRSWSIENIPEDLARGDSLSPILRCSPTTVTSPIQAQLRREGVHQAIWKVPIVPSCSITIGVKLEKSGQYELSLLDEKATLLVSKSFNVGQTRTHSPLTWHWNRPDFQSSGAAEFNWVSEGTEPVLVLAVDGIIFRAEAHTSSSLSGEFSLNPGKNYQPGTEVQFIVPSNSGLARIRAPMPISLGEKDGARATHQFKEDSLFAGMKFSLITHHPSRLKGQWRYFYRWEKYSKEQKPSLPENHSLDRDRYHFFNHETGDPREFFHSKERDQVEPFPWKTFLSSGDSAVHEIPSPEEGGNWVLAIKSLQGQWAFVERIGVRVKRDLLLRLEGPTHISRKDGIEYRGGIFNGSSEEKKISLQWLLTEKNCLDDFLWDSTFQLTLSPYEERLLSTTLPIFPQGEGKLCLIARHEKGLNQDSLSIILNPNERLRTDKAGWILSDSAGSSYHKTVWYPDSGFPEDKSVQVVLAKSPRAIASWFMGRENIPVTGDLAELAGYFHAHLGRWQEDSTVPTAQLQNAGEVFEQTLARNQKPEGGWSIHPSEPVHYALTVYILDLLSQWKGAKCLEMKVYQKGAEFVNRKLSTIKFTETADVQGLHALRYYLSQRYLHQHLGRLYRDRNQLSGFSLALLLKLALDSKKIPESDTLVDLLVSKSTYSQGERSWSGDLLNSWYGDGLETTARILALIPPLDSKVRSEVAVFLFRRFQPGNSVHWKRYGPILNALQSLGNPGKQKELSAKIFFNGKKITHLQGHSLIPLATWDTTLILESTIPENRILIGIESPGILAYLVRRESHQGMQPSNPGAPTLSLVRSSSGNLWDTTTWGGQLSLDETLLLNYSLKPEFGFSRAKIFIPLTGNWKGVSLRWFADTTASYGSSFVPGGAEFYYSGLAADSLRFSILLSPRRSGKLSLPPYEIRWNGGHPWRFTQTRDPISVLAKE